MVHHGLQEWQQAPGSMTGKQIDQLGPACASELHHNNCAQGQMHPSTSAAALHLVHLRNQVYIALQSWLRAFANELQLLSGCQPLLFIGGLATARPGGQYLTYLATRSGSWTGQDILTILCALPPLV